MTDNYSFIHQNKVLQIKEKDLWGPHISPYKDKVFIDDSSIPQMPGTKDEYIYIRANHTNDEIIDTTGWSLKSVVSNTRIIIPNGVLLLRMMPGNIYDKVQLAPGEFAVIHTGHSPIEKYAKSFHTNKCIRYLSQYYDFTPHLTGRCNPPQTVLPATPKNIKSFGSHCVEFINNKMYECTTYNETNIPKDLLPNCKTFIKNRFTYHGCLSKSLTIDGYNTFNNGGWYLYLGLDSELWRNSYEAIQLLDQNGDVVDVMRY